MMVIFPDIEKIIVEYLAAEFQSEFFRVSVKKTPAEQPQPDNEIVVTAAYGAEDNHVMKTASLTLEVYANNYASANSLALSVESFIRNCTGEFIKRAIVLLGPVRIEEEGQMEKRAIDIELIVRGSTQ